MARKKRLCVTEHGWDYVDTLPCGYLQSELDDLRTMTKDEILKWALHNGRSFESVLRRVRLYRKEHGDPPIPRPRRYT